ncbi:hypothetical protein HDU93_002174 [Gonapodya sp. JEL0774]|nr:hypothetical protein HDU93_002174 [Gonapodya sp. JEL0774]
MLEVLSWENAQPCSPEKLLALAQKYRGHNVMKAEMSKTTYKSIPPAILRQAANEIDEGKISIWRVAQVLTILSTGKYDDKLPQLQSMLRKYLKPSASDKGKVPATASHDVSASVHESDKGADLHEASGASIKVAEEIKDDEVLQATDKSQVKIPR